MCFTVDTNLVKKGRVEYSGAGSTGEAGLVPHLPAHEDPLRRVHCRATLWTPDNNEHSSKTVERELKTR